MKVNLEIAASLGADVFKTARAVLELETLCAKFRREAEAMGFTVVVGAAKSAQPGKRGPATPAGRQKVSEVNRSYWAAMTPKQRKREVLRRVTSGMNGHA